MVKQTDEPADAGDSLLAVKSLQGITHHVRREALAAFVSDRPPVFRAADPVTVGAAF